MNRRSAIATAAAFAGLLSFGSLPALADDNGAMVTFRDATYDKVTVEVRLGASTDPGNSIPFGNQTLTKGQTWDVDTGGLVVFWRREVNPGSGDGTFTPWERIVTDRPITQSV